MKYTDTDVAKAITIATELHGSQVDKAGKPYIYHPIRVMFTVRTQFWDEKTQIVAVLHDVVEDCNVTREMLVQNFDEEIADAVMSVSRNESEVYTSFIKRAKLNPIGRIVKIADLIDNLDPDRIAALPVSEQSIEKRYRKAIQYLLAEDETAAKLEF